LYFDETQSAGARFSREAHHIQLRAAPRPMVANNAPCQNCMRFTPMPFKHSFSAMLEHTKNQSWQNSSQSWLVTPTSSMTPSLSDTVFCSGDCLFSYLFRHELLSNKSPDIALHFFKRADEQRPWLGSPWLEQAETSSSASRSLGTRGVSE
jgi:hypothetical protein